VQLTSRYRLLEILNSRLLAAEARVLLMEQPAKLLQHLCVGRITLQHSHVGVLGAVILQWNNVRAVRKDIRQAS
jgi:hypothetical protein